VNLQVSRSVSGQVDVAVYTVTGKQVIRRVFSETQLITFSMEDNVSGMYFVKLNIEGKEFVKKLILDR
ncbi:MAG: T9SS type A sorting domain-containing protein, partial [Bacteroidales bacterium]|nr:T9SS type A sorting domain-containing protein [Bacteroidales bacterium]